MRPSESVKTKGHALSQLSLHRTFLIGSSNSRPFSDLRSQVQQQFRDVNLPGAELTTRAAETRSIRQLRRAFYSRQLRRDECADWSRIDRAVSVAAYLLIDRAGVQARATAYARERLARHGMREHTRAPVVHQNYMHLLRSFVVHATLNARDQRLIRGKALSSARARQQLQEHVQVNEARDDLLYAHHSDVHSRQTRCQARVAFVLQDKKSARLGHAEIDAAYACVGFGEALSEDAPRSARQDGDIIRRLNPNFFGEQL